MQTCGRLFGQIFLVIFGLIFVAVGIGIGVFGASAATAAADRAENMPALSVAALESRAIGSEVLVEGRISSRNPARFREFVAYVREEYRGNDDDGDPQWREDERVTPPLLLEVGGRLMQIGNSNYQFENPPVRWQESDLLRWNSFSGEGTKRYRGFGVGDPAMTIGTVEMGNEGRVVWAEFLFGGTRADYIASKRQDAAVLPWIGLIFGAVGGLFALIGGLLFVRRLLGGM